MLIGSVETDYIRTILYQNENCEVVSIEWTESSFTEMHDHGWSQCIVLVQEGIFENSLEGAAKVLYETGQTIVIPPRAKHEMRCLTSTGRTLNIYMPKQQTR